MEEYNIINIYYISIPMINGEEDILHLLKTYGGTLTLDELRSLARVSNNIGPLDLNFVVGSLGGTEIMKELTLKSILNIMSKKGTVVIDGENVRITGLGEILLEGITSKQLLPRIQVLKTEDKWILNQGQYLVEVDKPFSYEGLITPKCFLGIHQEISKKGEREFWVIAPTRIAVPSNCKVILKEIHSYPQLKDTTQAGANS